jgi:nucleotide-binding universal stress UspA family protein
MTTTDHTNPLRVVVGVDGSAQSKQALRWAATIAAATGARLDVVASWSLPAGYGWAGAEWNPEQDTEKILASTVDEVFGTSRPADMELTVREGGAASILLAKAEGALMLVVGSRGHGGFAGLLLGSVSASTAEHAQCPVLVVHGDTSPPELAPQASRQS